MRTGNRREISRSSKDHVERRQKKDIWEYQGSCGKETEEGYPGIARIMQTEDRRDIFGSNKDHADRRQKRDIRE